MTLSLKIQIPVQLQFQVQPLISIQKNFWGHKLLSLNLISTYQKVIFFELLLFLSSQALNLVFEYNFTVLLPLFTIDHSSFLNFLP
jgi:hypothetical protein